MKRQREYETLSSSTDEEDTRPMVIMKPKQRYYKRRFTESQINDRLGVFKRALPELKEKEEVYMRYLLEYRPPQIKKKESSIRCQLRGSGNGIRKIVSIPDDIIQKMLMIREKKLYDTCMLIFINLYKLWLNDEYDQLREVVFFRTKLDYHIRPTMVNSPTIMYGSLNYTIEEEEFISLYENLFYQLPIFDLDKIIII